MMESSLDPNDIQRLAEIDEIADEVDLTTAYSMLRRWLIEELSGD